MEKLRLDYGKTYRDAAKFIGAGINPRSYKNRLKRLQNIQHQGRPVVSKDLEISLFMKYSVIRKDQYSLGKDGQQRYQLKMPLKSLWNIVNLRVGVRLNRKCSKSLAPSLERRIFECRYE